MRVLYILIGLPGSGKSTFVKNNLADNAYVISTDGIRGELYGDEAIQGDGKKVFDVAYTRLNAYLDSYKKDIHVVFDATNLTTDARKQIFHKIPNKNEVKVVGVWVDTPVEECKRRNANRERKVPEEVIDRMARKMTPPSFKEPFDSIVVVAEDGKFILYERDE